MLILALDTSGKTASCAILRGGDLLCSGQRDSMLDHSRTLLALCQSLLDENGLAPRDIDVFAAVTGPGSFTGVRIGTAAVKAFGWTQQKPCAGVSSLLAMAFEADGDGVCCCRVTSRPGEFYYAFFRRQGGRITRLTEDSFAPPEDIDALCAKWGADAVLTDCQSARGAALAALQMHRDGLLQNCHDINPQYLKKPQAQRLREERLAAGGEGDGPPSNV